MSKKLGVGARLPALVAAFLFALGGNGAPVAAQTYPTNNPSYIPTAVLPAVSCSAACIVTLNTNGVGTATFRISGSGTGIAATVQVSNDRATSPTFTGVTAYPIGSTPVKTITAAGLYRVNTEGAAYVRLNLTAVTGSVSISGAATPSSFAEVALQPRKATYSASIAALAPAASATDLITLTGNANTTVEVTHTECSGVSTAAATASLEAVVRSTADSAGTPSAMTAVPHDSNDPAAQGTVTAYTANPTTGTLVGIVAAGKLSTNTAATSAFGAQTLVWDFGAKAEEQPVILRGATQVFALNGAGASFTAGAALNCTLRWTEF